jgi:hypothetical protein
MALYFYKPKSSIAGKIGLDLDLPIVNTQEVTVLDPVTNKVAPVQIAVECSRDLRPDEKPLLDQAMEDLGYIPTTKLVPPYDLADTIGG